MQESTMRELRTWFNQPVLNVLDRMRDLIMTSAEDLASRIDAATNAVAADLTEFKAELAAALAQIGSGATQEQIDAAVAEQLAKLDAPIQRLEALGADNANPVPTP